LEPSNLIMLAGVFEAVGAILAMHMASKVLRASRITGDKSLTLLAVGLLFYSLGLGFEMVGSFFAWGTMYAHAPRRVEELPTIMLNRGTLLGMPLFTVSYVLMAASLYVGHVRVEGEAVRAFSVLPFIAYVYADYNLVNLIVLAAAAYYNMARYGTARLGNTLFYAIAGASHLFGVLIVFWGDWLLLLLSMVLRGLAAVALYVASRLGGGS